MLHKGLTRGLFKDVVKERQTVPKLLKMCTWSRNAKRLLYRAIGQTAWNRIRDIVDELRTLKYRETLPRAGIILCEKRWGINIIGPITADGGVAEGIRGMIKAAKVAGIPYALNNAEIGYSQNVDLRYAHELANVNPYTVNLVHLNADKVRQFYYLKRPNYWKGKYNIGYWVWELATFPEKWHDRFRYIDEIWVPSQFCASVLGHVCPLPVIKIAHAIDCVQDSQGNRQYFCIPDDRFVLLFMFDFYSIFERKNPLAVIDAFKKAFTPDEPVILVIKYANPEVNPKDEQRLLKAASGHAVQFLRGHFSREQITRLVASCDVYVSLHRSEGFGLTIAEAMSLAKPVIATNYSGNTDYMNSENSFPVKYRLKELERDFGPYRRGNVWADPDIDEAARLMRDVYENRERAQDIGRRAAQYIREEYSPMKIGEEIKCRLSAILQ